MTKKLLLLGAALFVLPMVSDAAPTTFGVVPGSGAGVVQFFGDTVGGQILPGSAIVNPNVFTQQWLINGTGEGPVAAADGSLVTLGAKSDTASNGAGASVVSLLHQANVNNTAGSAAPGATSVSAAAIQGAVASGGAQIASPLPDGGRAATAEPTAVADGQAVGLLLDKKGRTVTAPWAVPELYVRGKATVVITTPATLLAASGVASQFTYLTSMQCGNSSATGVWVTLSDSNATPIFVPPTGGNNPQFNPPLVSSSLNAAITAVGDSTQTTVRCSATGYRGL